MGSFRGEYLLYLFYPALAALLLAGAKFAGKGEKDIGFMTRSNTKAICGLLSLCVILHHVSQSISDQRIFEPVNTRGLGPFFYSGYLFVGYYLFCSGFGLVKSFKTKDNYLEGFGKKRVLPILVTFAFTGLIYLVVRSRTSGPAFPANPYSWYVYTLLLLYFFFWLVFGKLKRCRILCVGILVLLYCVLCRAFGLGEWVFNSAPAFVLGMLTAAREDRIRERLSRRYWVRLAAYILLFALFFALSRGSGVLYRLSGGIIPYAVFREAVPALQAVSACFFCMFIAALGMKIRFGNVCLAFLGGLTLEIYLIQGLFVNLFGEYIFGMESRSPLYIRSYILYALAVIAASLLSAFLIGKICGFITDFLVRAPFAKVLWKDAKKVGRVLAIIAVVLTVFYSLSSHSTSREITERLEKYRSEIITGVSVGGNDIAAYVTGSGSRTVVMLRGDSEPCPTMGYRPLADVLSEKYRVVVIDFPGQGFSGPAVTERTADNIAQELRAALHELGEDGEAVLVADGISGIYALSYIEKYPDKVSALIGVDAYVPGLSRYLAGEPYSSDEEYTWALQRNARSNELIFRIMSFTGFSRFELSTVDYLFDRGVMSKYTKEIQEMYMRCYYNSAAADEKGRMHQNCLSAADAKLPPDMPALFLIDTDSRKAFERFNRDESITAEDVCGTVITDKSRQKIMMIDNRYVIYYNPRAVGDVIDDFLRTA